jgi:hypothetical protein
VDGPRFDALTQRLASIRLTRGSALRGLAASTLTLAGLATVADEASAAKKPYCACENANSNCTTEFAGRRARKRYIKQHPCSYKGECRGSGSHNPCEDAAVDIDINVNLLNILCPLGTECGDSNVTGLICLNGRCRPEDCQDIVDLCGPNNNLQCCVADATCVAGVCLLPLSSL